MLQYYITDKLGHTTELLKLEMYYVDEYLVKFSIVTGKSLQ